MRQEEEEMVNHSRPLLLQGQLKLDPRLISISCAPVPSKDSTGVQVCTLSATLAIEACQL